MNALGKVDKSSHEALSLVNFSKKFDDLLVG